MRNIRPERHLAPALNQSSPIASFSSGRTVTVSESLDSIVGNNLSIPERRVFGELLHFLVQIRVVPTDRDVVLLGSIGAQEVVEPGRPVEIVDDGHAVAVQNVLQASGPRAALCMQDESVAAEILDRNHVVVAFGFGVPRDLGDVRPLLAFRHLHQRFSDKLIRPHDASPDGFWNFVDEEAFPLGSAISHFSIGCSEEACVVHVWHHPESMLVAIDDAPGESPDGVGVGATREQSHIIDRHREFDRWELLPDSGGACDSPVDLREE